MNPFASFKNVSVLLEAAQALGSNGWIAPLQASVLPHKGSAVPAENYGFIAVHESSGGIYSSIQEFKALKP